MSKQTKVIEATALFSASQENELIKRATQGDQLAFNQLYQQHERRIYALCWRMLADRETAEDVTQEVFVQVWQKLGSFRGDSKFSTWLHSVATNVVLSHIRKHKNWLQRVFSIEDQVNGENLIEAHEGDSGSTLAELSALDKHIMRLPERARLVFVLFAVEGYRHEEIATKMGMAVGSSKAQYHRARNLLKEWLAA